MMWERIGWTLGWWDVCRTFAKGDWDVAFAPPPEKPSWVEWVCGVVMILSICAGGAAIALEVLA